MLAEAQIPIGTAKSGLFVPADAVQQIDGQDAVFVQVSADHFAVRPVVTAPQVSDQVPITEGLMPGEHVVTHGAFLLKSELLKSSLPSD
jgi:membrane fusion protein, heavy metal efflux system